MWKQAIAQEVSQGKKQNTFFFFLFTRKVKHVTNQQWNRISIVVAGNTEQQSTVSQWDWQVQSPRWIWNRRDLVSFLINLSGLDGHRVCGRYSNAGFHSEACLCCSSWYSMQCQPVRLDMCVCLDACCRYGARGAQARISIPVLLMWEEDTQALPVSQALSAQKTFQGPFIPPKDRCQK